MRKNTSIALTLLVLATAPLAAQEPAPAAAAPAPAPAATAPANPFVLFSRKQGDKSVQFIVDLAAAEKQPRCLDDAAPFALSPQDAIAKAKVFLEKYKDTFPSPKLVSLSYQAYARTAAMPETPKLANAEGLWYYTATFRIIRATPEKRFFVSRTVIVLPDGTVVAPTPEDEVVGG